MIIQKTVFETPDGKQFPTQEAAERHMLHEDLKEAIREGAHYDGVDAEESLNALLLNFNITRKEKESD